MSLFNRINNFISALLVFSAPALAASNNLYKTDVIIQEPVGEDHREPLAREVYRALTRSQIQRLTIQGSAVGNLDQEQFDEDTISQLPITVLLALRLGCYHSVPSSTWNVLLPLLSGDLIPANLTRRDKMHLVIEIGEAFQPVREKNTPSEAELRRRYGIGPLNSYGREWTDSQRNALDSALATLTLEERLFIKDITFERRSHSGIVGRGKHVADYFQRGDTAKIYLYDRAFEHDQIAYIGTPARPFQNSVFGILHEVGHLIAAAPSLRSFRRAQELQRAYDGLYLKYEDAYDEHISSIEQLNDAQVHREPLEAHVVHTIERVQQFEGELERALERTERENRLALKYQASSPVVEGYKRVRTNKKGPTAYGRTEVNEGFAEAFAIYHTDPMALRWIDPAVYEWFRDGTHLSIISEHAESH